MSNTYYIALVKGYGHRNYWRNGHADSTVIVQCRRSRDYLSPDTWQYMGEHITTKARLRENKTALLTEINRKFNTSFTHVVIDWESTMNTAPYTLTLVFCDENMPRMHYNARDKTDAQAQGAHWLKQFASIKYLKVSNHAALETSYYDATGAHLFTAPLPKKESTP